jgi:uncharacterized protein YjbI with pentapeptide repeats
LRTKASKKLTVRVYYREFRFNDVLSALERWEIKLNLYAILNNVELYGVTALQSCIKTGNNWYRYMAKVSSAEQLLEQYNQGDRNFEGSDLDGANLSGLALKEINLSRASLRKADLTGADLSSALLFQADLSTAILNRVDLSRANLTGQILAVHF